MTISIFLRVFVVHADIDSDIWILGLFLFVGKLERNLCSAFVAEQEQADDQYEGWEAKKQAGDCRILKAFC